MKRLSSSLRGGTAPRFGNSTICSKKLTCIECVGIWDDVPDDCLWCAAVPSSAIGGTCVERAAAEEQCQNGALRDACGSIAASYIFVLVLASALCCCCSLALLRRLLARWASRVNAPPELTEPLLDGGDGGGGGGGGGGRRAAAAVFNVAGGGGDAGEAAWRCPVCTFDNRPHAADCDLCGTSKGFAGAYQRHKERKAAAVTSALVPGAKGRHRRLPLRCGGRPAVISATASDGGEGDDSGRGSGGGDGDEGDGTDATDEMRPLLGAAGLPIGVSLGSIQEPNRAVVEPGASAAARAIARSGAAALAGAGAVGAGDAAVLDAAEMEWLSSLTEQQRIASFGIRRMNRLNERQKRARRRKLWCRVLSDDGSLQWMRASRRGEGSGGDGCGAGEGSSGNTGGSGSSGSMEARSPAKESGGGCSSGGRRDSFGDDAMLSLSPGYYSSLEGDGGLMWREADVDQVAPPPPPLPLPPLPHSAAQTLAGVSGASVATADAAAAEVASPDIEAGLAAPLAEAALAGSVDSEAATSTLATAVVSAAVPATAATAASASPPSSGLAMSSSRATPPPLPLRTRTAVEGGVMDDSGSGSLAGGTWRLVRGRGLVLGGRARRRGRIRSAIAAAIERQRNGGGAGAGGGAGSGAAVGGAGSSASVSEMDAEGGSGGIDTNPERLCEVAALPFWQKHVWLLDQLSILQVPHGAGLEAMKIEVHRDNLLEDSFTQVISMNTGELRRWLRVQFVDEPGVDAGGLEREWFLLVTQALFDPAAGLFVYCENGSLDVNPASGIANEMHLEYFAFAGRVLAKLLMEHSVVPHHLALPVLKHFLSVPITFSDIEFVDAELFRNLSWLRSNSGAETLGLDMTVTTEHFGAKLVMELVPGGAGVAVTDANKDEYLRLRLRHRMLDAVRPQLEALLRGFYEVVPPALVSVFDYQELELLLCGIPQIDPNDWMGHTNYTGEYRHLGERHPVIQWFWEVVRDFTDEERARLLQFCTGSSRLPAHGFKALQSNDGNFRRFTIQSVRKRDMVFPRAHTCFNKLDLPVYESRKELEEYVSAVISMELTGFTID